MAMMALKLSANVSKVGAILRRRWRFKKDAWEDKPQFRSYFPVGSHGLHRLRQYPQHVRTLEFELQDGTKKVGKLHPLAARKI
jgi:hypothetical protein